MIGRVSFMLQLLAWTSLFCLCRTGDDTEDSFNRLFGSRVLHGDFAVEEVILGQKEDIDRSVARWSMNGRKSPMNFAPSTWLCKSTRSSIYNLPEHATHCERRMPTSAAPVCDVLVSHASQPPLASMRKAQRKTP